MSDETDGILDPAATRTLGMKHNTGRDASAPSTGSTVNVIRNTSSRSEVSGVSNLRDRTIQRESTTSRTVRFVPPPLSIHGSSTRPNISTIARMLSDDHDEPMIRNDRARVRVHVPTSGVRNSTVGPNVQVKEMLMLMLTETVQISETLVLIKFLN